MTSIKITRVTDRWWERAARHNWRKEEFGDRVDWPDKVVVAVEVLDSQVKNGGFSQWWNNGYYDAFPNLQRWLRKSVDTPTAHKVADLINVCRSAMDDYEDNHGNMDILDQELDMLDGDYYNIADRLIEDVDSWYIAQTKIEP